MRILHTLILGLALLSLSCRAHTTTTTDGASQAQDVASEGQPIWSKETPYIPSQVFIDCNGNGLSDSLDVATGVSLDNDRDGVADDCFPDSNQVGAIDTLETTPPSVRIGIYYMKDRSIRLTYVVAKGRHRIRSVAQIDGTSDTVLSDSVLGAGVHILQLPITSRNPLPITGTGQLVVSADSAKIVRKLAWNWATRR